MSIRIVSLRILKWRIEKNISAICFLYGCKIYFCLKLLICDFQNEQQYFSCFPKKFNPQYKKHSFFHYWQSFLYYCRSFLYCWQPAVYYCRSYGHCWQFALYYWQSFTLCSQPFCYYNQSFTYYSQSFLNNEQKLTIIGLSQRVVF